MSANVVVVLLLVCMAGKLVGAALLPTDQPHQWREFVASVEQKLTTMERQLAAKDVRINELETKLENHIAVFTKYKNDAENGLQAKNSAIKQLKQQLTSLSQKVSEAGLTSGDLGKRVSDLEQLNHANHLNGEKRRELSAAFTSAIKETPEEFIASHNNHTYDDLQDISSNSTEVSANKIPHQERTLATSRTRRTSRKANQRDCLSGTEPGLNSHVAFHLELVSSQSVTKGATVRYDRVVLDEGNDYNLSDGVYTVPESGTYVFTWTTMSGFRGYIQTRLIANGHIVGSSFTDADEIHDLHQTTALVVLQCSLGEHVFIRVNNNKNGIMYSSLDQGARPTFSGWKLF